MSEEYNKNKIKEESFDKIMKAGKNEVIFNAFTNGSTTNNKIRVGVDYGDPNQYGTFFGQNTTQPIVPNTGNNVTVPNGSFVEMNIDGMGDEIKDAKIKAFSEEIGLKNESIKELFSRLAVADLVIATLLKRAAVDGVSVSGEDVKRKNDGEYEELVLFSTEEDGTVHSALKDQIEAYAKRQQLKVTIAPRSRLLRDRPVTEASNV